eukprot:symbB.v1.2.037112.t1/scaffold5388.1/size27657/2
MLEVVSAVTGESIAVFEEVDFAEGSVKALKQRLAQKIGIPRFRLRLFQDNSALDDDQTLMDDQAFTVQVVQLVILEFQPPDREQDEGIMVACQQNDDKLLEQQLNKPRSPNFQDANQITPLYAAARNGSLKCVLLLLEAGANKNQGKADTGSPPLFIAAWRGHLEVVRVLVESDANKDQGRTHDGATPLFIAAHQGHLEVVRFLVESGSCMFVNKNIDLVCGRCRAPNPAEQLTALGLLPNPLAQQWACPSCGFQNKGSNKVCGGTGPLGCKSPKPAASVSIIN